MKLAEDLVTDRSISMQLRRAWPAFFGTFGRLTEVQRSAIPRILNGDDVLICSATASGKTEAACAPLVERWIDYQQPWTILYISPTRALVNDLYVRLFEPLNRLGFRLKRRTGDHRDHLKPIPHVLLTAPESFDSLLCRGKLDDSLGNILAHVHAVVLDEIHLLHGTARGEQVRWLIKRLELLRQFALKKNWIKDDAFQIIGLSATLPNPESVAETYLRSGEIIRVPGSRQIDVINQDKKGTVEQILPRYLESISVPEKVLVFSNSRRRVDNLVSVLNLHLSELGYVSVAHHGSLGKKIREEAERLAKEEEKVVVFATSTLEIGIDIGNIDVVVLDGPAPDIPALLQRIGRGNRRTSKTRVITCINSEKEAVIHLAMTKAASDGWLGTGDIGSQFAVAKQQVASYIFQASGRSRSSEKMQKFMNDFAEPIVAKSLIQGMVESGELIKTEEGLLLGESWLEKSSRGDIHSNIEELPGLTVVDERSGEKIAKGVLFQSGKGLRTGGQLLEVRKQDHRQIEVKHVSDQNFAEGDWRYTSQAGFKGDGQAQALRWYLKLNQNQWPVIYQGGFAYIFHFGGARRSAIIELIYSEAQAKKKLKTVNSFFIVIPIDDNEIVKPVFVRNASSALLEIGLVKNLDLLERRLGRPLANKKLPLDLRVEEVKRWLNLQKEVAVLREAEWRSVTQPDIIKVLKSLI
jgi:ATP-dependent helicase Lhr and Lhr-like helicase